MKDLLIELKNFGALGIKAEFESEGATYDEILKLKDLSDFDLTVKIGGVGALNDVNMARELGAKNIVAPMVESPYAVEKFLSTAGDGKENLYINIETITGYENFNKMNLNELSGVVFGRSDMAFSINDGVESQAIFEMAKNVANSSKDFILGGSIGVKSLPFIQKLKLNENTGCARLKFETRKIIFDGEKASEKGILLALKFELEWLKYIKKDEKRILYLSEMLSGIRQN